MLASLAVDVVGDGRNAVVVCGGLIALGTVARWLYRVLKKAGEAEDAYPILMELAKLQPELEKMRAEFHPNGGGSLRDAVDAIRESQTRAEGWMIVTDDWKREHDRLDTSRFEALAAAARRAGWDLDDYPGQTADGRPA